jgi:hypothetical protein
MTNTPIDTMIAISAGGSGTVYIGANAPVGQQPGPYSQTINVLASC